MSINDMYDVADRIEQRILEAVEFGQNRNMVLDIMKELADQIREEADDIEKRISDSYCGA
jgi:hypothetical protein